MKKLCRFLGFGLLTVAADCRVEVVVEPVPWKPRRDAKRRSRLVAEHRRRRGYPVVGGSTRLPQMSAYRRQALAVAQALRAAPSRPRDHRARKILRSGFQPAPIVSFPFRMSSRSSGSIPAHNQTRDGRAKPTRTASFASAQGTAVIRAIPVCARSPRGCRRWRRRHRRSARRSGYVRRRRRSPAPRPARD